MTQLQLTAHFMDKLYHHYHHHHHHHHHIMSYSHKATTKIQKAQTRQKTFTTQREHKNNNT